MRFQALLVPTRMNITKRSFSTVCLILKRLVPRIMREWHESDSESDSESSGRDNIIESGGESDSSSDGETQRKEL